MDGGVKDGCEARQKGTKVTRGEALARGDLFGGSPYLHYTRFHVICDAHLTPSQFQCDWL